MNLSVYFVTPHNPDDSLVLAALKGGASIIQLRDKTAPDDVLIEQATRLNKIAQSFNVPFIINDRPQCRPRMRSRWPAYGPV